MHLLKIAFTLCWLSTAIYSSGQQAACFRQAGGNVTFDGSGALNEYNGYCVGELHGVKGTPEIKLALIKYLHREHGVRAVFIETGIAAAYLYNRYLQTGDTTLITKPALVYAQHEPAREFWRQLYIYNKGLKDKLTIYGMDFERMEFLKVMKLLMRKGGKVPAEIAPAIDYIMSVTVADVNSDSLIDVYDRIKSSFQYNRDAYKEYMGTATFEIAEQVLLNANTSNKFAQRNRYMQQYISTTLQKERLGRFVVFAGMNHVSKADDGSLYSRLVQKMPGRKLVSIAMTCMNCYDRQLKPGQRLAPFRGPYAYEPDSVQFKGVYSRYFDSRCKYVMIPAAVTGNSLAGSYSDYIVLMKDQGEY
ncbi:MAG: erythromycin esterase family protein [Bacteroidota bacterium]